MLGFRGKQIATITLVASAVVIATSLINAMVMTRAAVEQTRERSQLLAETLYHQAREALRRRDGQDLRAALATEPALRTYAQAIVGYSGVTLYMAIFDQDGRILFHSDPLQEGELVRPALSIEELSERPALVQLWLLTRRNRVLAVDLPFSLGAGDQPTGTVRVAVSSLLLEKQLSGAIALNASIAAGAILIVLLASFYLANRLLAPIEMLRRELGGIDLGRDQPRLDLRNEADISRVAEFFASISQRLGQDRELRESGYTWLDTMLGALSDAVVVVSGERRIVSLNTPARRWFGASGAGRPEPQGQLMDAVLPLPILSLVDEVLRRGESLSARTLLLPIEGHGVPFSVNAQILRQAGLVTGVIVTGRDVEQLARLGSHLSYTQKLAALGRLTSGVAHEIKNPLNALVLHTALLREKCGDEGVLPHLDVLDREVRRLDRVVEGFLKFTRPEQLELEAVPLEQILDEVLGLASGLAEKSGIRVERDVPAGIPPIHGDPNLLRQALHNLVLNACEAMPQGGRLRAEVRQSAADQRTVITIEDTGPGISPEVLPRIFDLYFTTKISGTGLGLSLSYRIVQLHGGEIEVHSRAGEGTRFVISLPEAQA